jgi:23S rRNA (cytidine2498-2'-O)-methyltransferase
VTAVDNGRLKEPIRSHPHIIPLKEDALRFAPQRRFDWLFCDMIENPDLILNLLIKWLKNSWCSRFVVNLKIGRSDPISLLKKIKDPKLGLTPHCSFLKIRHLYHDREEITVTGNHLSKT